MTAPTAIPTARRRTPRSGGRRPIVWLFGVGATAATLSLVLGPASIDRTQVAGICGATWGLAAILCFVPRRLPRWAVHLLLAAGTLLVEWITLASGDMTSPYPILYFWVATCAFCFLSRVEAAAQGLLIAIAYAAGLALTPDHHAAGGVLRWTLFALALAVGGAFIGALRTQHDRLMAELRSVTRADPLTGLLDRRGFDEALCNELERARRSGSRFGLILGSIDGYDGIPPVHRKAVLASAGATIAGAKRDIDTGARLEDDQFAILATYTDERGADVLAGRICAAVREGGATMSLGVVSYPRHGGAAGILLNAAGEARDEAVGRGGDRSLVAVSAADSIAARLHAPDVQVVPLRWEGSPTP